ncbi:MAG TPA: biopolymer transporter ExbD [Longimicrobiales bacterium]|nr:biopolymer transporter ExbD [Longimicrobiales bacterium]
MGMQSHDIKDTNVMADINVTPMVDVMLVLLVIFMIVTPAIVAGFKAQLPDGVNLLSRPEEEDRTVLGIDMNGAYYLNKRPIAAGDAAALLRAEFERHPEDRVLFIKADRSLRYGEMMKAMELGREAGARVIAAVTEQSPGTESNVRVVE